MITITNEDKKFISIMRDLIQKAHVNILKTINVSLDGSGRLMFYATGLNIIYTYTRNLSPNETFKKEFVFVPDKILKIKNDVEIDIKTRKIADDEKEYEVLSYKVGVMETFEEMFDIKEYPEKIQGLKKELCAPIEINWDILQQLQPAISTETDRRTLMGWGFTTHGIIATDGRRLYYHKCDIGLTNEKGHNEFVLSPSKCLTKPGVQKLLSKSNCSVQLFGDEQENSMHVYFQAANDEWMFEIIHSHIGTPPKFMQIIPDINEAGDLIFTDKDVEVLRQIPKSKNKISVNLNRNMKIFCNDFGEINAPFNGKKHADIVLNCSYLCDMFDLGITQFKQNDGFSPIYGKNDRNIEAVLMPTKP
jgi:hypothetical protein